MRRVLSLVRRFFDYIHRVWVSSIAIGNGQKALNGASMTEIDRRFVLATFAKTMVKRNYKASVLTIMLIDQSAGAGLHLAVHML